MRKLLTAIGMSFLSLLFFSSTTFAHVTVNPREATPGFSVATVRVPNEKDIPTVSVRVIIPDGVTVHGIKTIPGWTYTVVHETADGSETTPEESEHTENGESGRITEITWTGGQVGSGEFEEFPLSVQYKEQGDYTWKAYQTYSDGEIVNWEGAKDSEHPASIVAVAEAEGADQPTTAPIIGAQQTQWLSIAAILLSLAAIFISLRKK